MTVVVVDKFAKTQEMIDQTIEAQEMAAQVGESNVHQIQELDRKVDNLREHQIKELERKAEGLWYAVVALSTIMAVHILYHVVPPLIDFFFGL